MSNNRHAMHMEPPTNGPMHDPDDSGAYDIEPEVEKNAPAAKPVAAAKPLFDDDDDSIDAEPGAIARTGADADADADGDDSLPPPISRPSPPMPWLVAGGTAIALVAISWLAGAEQLTLPDADGRYEELSFGARLAGLARTLVFAPIATLGAVFGVLGLAFLRQRPVGDVAALFAKCFAIVSVPIVLWLVPIDVRFLKQALNVVCYPAAAGLLAIPAFRLAPADAALATGLAALGMTLVVLAASVVVWAVGM